MKLVVCFLVCGLCALAVGIGTCFAYHDLAKIDDSVLAKVMVSGTCEKCVDPEVSCPSRACFDTGSGTCQEWDDWIAIEDNSCTADANKVCVLSDWWGCYEVDSWPKPSSGGCFFNGCQMSPTEQWTYEAWDDCIDGPI